MSLSEKESEEVVKFVKSLCNDKNQLDDFVSFCNSFSNFLKFFHEKIKTEKDLYSNSKYLIDQINLIFTSKINLINNYNLDVLKFNFFVQQFNLLNDVKKLILQNLN